MRLLSSLIKYIIYLSVILIAAGSALFWFDTGSWLVLPLAERAGNFFLSPMKLDIHNINGSLREGYSLEGLKLTSGDNDIITLNYASVSPDWDLVLNGMNGLPFIKNLELSGISTDLDKVLLLSNHFASSNDKKPDDPGEPDSPDQKQKLKLNPFNISINDLNFGTQYANISLDALTLNPDGILRLNSSIVSRDYSLPLKAEALLDLNNIAVTSSSLNIGQKSRGSLTAALEPLSANLSLTALSLDELLHFSPPIDIKASGRLDARINALSQDGNIKASGVVSMPRANIADIPMNFRMPFNFDGNTLRLNDANLHTRAAALTLNALTDINTLHVKADGEAHNISLNELGRIFAPKAGLDGEGGELKFNLDTTLSGDILRRTDADITAGVPSVSAGGMRILKDLSAHLKLIHNDAPKISLNGQAFGGKLFARGEALQDTRGNIKPQAVISIVNLDINTLIHTFPDLAKSIAKPSGRVTATARISDNLNISGQLTSDKLTANGVTISGLNASANVTESYDVSSRITLEKLNSNGITLNDILAELKYDYDNNTAVLDIFRAVMGRGTIGASGSADIKAGTFTVNADAEDIDTRTIPELKELSGRYDLKASASGNYNDIKTIKAEGSLTGRNMAYSGTKIGSLALPVNFSNNILNINNARADFPGGSLNLKGSVNLKNTSNPFLDISASTKGINLAKTLEPFKLGIPITGNIKGDADIKGPLKSAGVNLGFKADNVKAGDLVNIPSAFVVAKGDMNKINVQKLEARINSADINGSGTINIDHNNLMNSHVNVSAAVRRLALKPLLKNFTTNPPLSGVINGNVTLRGNISKPALDLKLNRPITYGNKYDIHDIALTLRAPEANHYTVNAKARLENFKAEADIDAKNHKGTWLYKVDTKPLDLNAALESQSPDLSGIVKGNARLSLSGSSMPNTPINAKITAHEINIIDKVKVRDISLPVSYNPAKNKAEIRNAKAVLSDGIITPSVEVDLNNYSFKGDIDVKHLDFGKLAAPFMPEGELVGSLDAELDFKGGLVRNGEITIMPLSFGNGKFKTSPGYLHKMKILDKVTPTKRISFEEISGSFFWDGRDIFLNPGTGARAGRDEPLYRYFTVNGSMGLYSKDNSKTINILENMNMLDSKTKKRMKSSNNDGSLNLLCEGRFDLKLLDQLLGAMKGIFQYMTGSLASTVLRDAAGRVLGVKRRDFQNVSFTLSNSWQDLRLLNLKITKPIEDFLPIDVLNRDEEKQKDDVQFKLRLKIPTGPGDKSIEEESAGDQFKQQLIDNLFNIGM